MSVKDVWEFMVTDNYGDLKPLNRQHLPFLSEWGGYTMTYLTEQGNELCAECATRSLYLLDEESDPVIAYGTYDEGPVIRCDGCNREIESSYGAPDAKECVIEETMSGFICAECGDDCECAVCILPKGES